MANLNPTITASIITATLALIGTIISLIWNYFSNKKSQREIEILKSNLADQEAERDARRDYIYEAKKRLYKECEPLIFQLTETAENFLHRVYSLARSARKGSISINCEGWLSHKGYYLASTIYHLLSPLAIYRLIQKRLTLVDLSVDPRIKAQYLLAKQLYFAFTDDFEFARINTKLAYDPNVSDWIIERDLHPAKCWRQGFPIGLLDIAVDSLLTSENDNKYRLKNFGEFEKDFYEELEVERVKNSLIAKGKKRTVLVADVFLGFHPLSRPVLWRVLVTQAQICKVLIKISELEYDQDIPSLLQYLDIHKDDLKYFEWRDKKETYPDSEVYEVPFNVAKSYLIHKLGFLFR